MQKALTDAYITALKPPASGRAEIADTRCIGLVLRVTTGGSRSWSFRFRARGGGGVRRVTLGQYPDLGLSKARSQANDMRAVVAAGGDPAQVRREQRGGGKTFSALSERYIVEHARRHKRTANADEQNLRLHVLPKWRNRPYATITRGDVIELVEGIVAAGKGTQANRVQSLISTIFTFALDAALVTVNPCHRLAKRGVENVRSRVLTNGELRMFWQGVTEPKAARHTGLGLQLALLTGTRVGEVAALSRAELQNIDKPTMASWLLPGSRTKNGRDHLIPLATLARQTVLDLLELIEPDEPFLFPTRSAKRKGPVEGHTLTQAMVYFADRIAPDEDQKLAADDPVATWFAHAPTPHDLRRTVGTRLAELGIAQDVRDKIMNHAPRDVGSRHYNAHDYVNEKRAALSRWEGALTTILANDSTVVSLTGRRTA